MEARTEFDSYGMPKGGRLLLELSRRSVVVGAQSNDLAGGSYPLVEARSRSDFEETQLKSTYNGSLEEICLQ